MKIITTNNGEEYKKRNFIVNSTAVTAGLIGYSAIRQTLNYALCRPLAKNIVKYGKQADSVEINNALNSILKEPKVAEKNIKIIDFDKLPKIQDPNIEDYIKNLYESVPPKYKEKVSYSKEILEQETHVMDILNKFCPNRTKSFKSLNDFFAQKYRYALQEGRTAMALLPKNDIFVNLKKLPSATFHELGHIMNPATNIIAARCKFVLPFIVGATLLTRKKVDGEDYKNKFDKVVSTARKNAPLIAMASLMPVVSTEVLASYKGTQLAKPYISKKTLNTLTKLHLSGAGTYLITMVTTGLSLWGAKKIKDKIAAPKLIENS